MDVVNSTLAGTAPVEGIVDDGPRRALTEGFPGPAVTGICMIAAPVLGVIGSALAIGVYHYKGTDMVRGMAEHHSRGIAGLNVGVTAAVLMIFVVASLARAICTDRLRIGRAAGVLTILGLAGPIFFQGMFWGASYLTAPGRRAAGAHLIDSTDVIPSTIINVSGPALIVGFILLAVGSAKVRLLSRPKAVCLGLAALLPFGFISGYIVISVVGFAFAGVALVPLGLAAFRPADEPTTIASLR